jgi:predicted nucleic acid-binding protein
LALYQRAKLIAPELLVPECANVLWKKVRRQELSKEQALLAAGLLERAEIELLPMRPLLEPATRIAIDLDHPAYDCLYLALAAANKCRFITADDDFGARSCTPGRASFAVAYSRYQKLPPSLRIGR